MSRQTPEQPAEIAAVKPDALAERAINSGLRGPRIPDRLSPEGYVLRDAGDFFEEIARQETAAEIASLSGIPIRYAGPQRRAIFETSQERPGRQDRTFGFGKFRTNEIAYQGDGKDR